MLNADCKSYHTISKAKEYSKRVISDAVLTQHVAEKAKVKVARQRH